MTTNTIERTSIVTYAIMDELHKLMARPGQPDDVNLGIIMGLAMFMDDKIGPMRSQHLLEQAPAIVLKTDAHVTDGQVNNCLDLLKAFGEHLMEKPAATIERSKGKVV